MTRKQRRKVQKRRESILRRVKFVARCDIHVEFVHGLLPPDHKFVIPILYRREVTE